MQPLLPPLDSHPVRGAIPHMYSVLEGVFGKPIKDVRDCRLQDALDILKFTLDNVKEYSIMKQLRERYSPEPDDLPSPTLDIFFE
jgi:hypothetical protein